jgi:hypothetical protein
MTVPLFDMRDVRPDLISVIHRYQHEDAPGRSQGYI